MIKRINNLRANTNNKYTSLTYLSPSNKLKNRRIVLDRKSDELRHAIQRGFEDKKGKLAILCAKLSGLSPLDKLSQGYLMANDNEGNVVKSINDININDEITINVYDGDIKATINDIIATKRQ